MTRDEFKQIAVVLDECWPGDFTVTAEAAYFAVLQEKTASVIEQACRELVNRGARFRPTPSELVSAAAGPSRARFLLDQQQAFAARIGEQRAAEMFAPVLRELPSA
jgi:hypothetical protein